MRDRAHESRATQTQIDDGLRASGGGRLHLPLLLKWQPENDKSQFLAQAGYGGALADQLAQDIRSQLLPLDAVFEETTEYGDTYRIAGTLTGPNGRPLRVVSIWMSETASGLTKFITLYPAKEH